ncbi:helix-turn-helix domain-containing protein [Streptomyces sp. NPDC000658]|uniref:helix-turn-helix transcriptional regulator n=1 Tax=Streptomyces sp. NPDC000658 TaxID=3154266 RepID=UPI00331ED7D5
MTAGTELLTVPQVMERLQLGRTAVYDLIRARRIPAPALDHLITTRLDQEAA